MASSVDQGNAHEHAVYKALDPSKKEIRVLNISPCLSRGRIVGSLEIVSLEEDEELAYEALSWCWGPPSSGAEILLNGKVTTISLAARDTLYNLCILHKHFRVWMDAVCINQRNVLERSQQVAIMKDVYSRADRVLIRLGEEDEFSATAAEQIHLLHTHCLGELPTEADQRNAFWGDGILRYSDGPLPACNWNAIIEFYSAPWFTRLWVMQEVMLAREAICYKGPHRIPWSTISLVAQWLEHRLYSRSEYCFGIKQGIDNASAMWRNTHNPEPLDLMNLLYISSDFQASLPHDKIYGCLGLHEAGLAVDYDQKVETVYAQATRAAILERNGSPKQLDILNVLATLVPPGQNQAPTPSPDWPSWVPHFDWVSGADMGIPIIRTFGKGASNGLSSVAEHANESVVLSLKGFLIGKVSFLGARLTDELCDDAKHFSTEILHCREKAGQHDENAFARTLTSGITDDYANAAEDDTFLRDYQHFVTSCEESGQAPVEPEDLGYHYYNAIWQGSGNRKFFAANEGQYLGMGPPHMKVGDRICVLLGGRVPYVLRPADEKNEGLWRLIGSAYVDGVMNVSTMDLHVNGGWHG